jgi:crotonobetainyl-CoA:carnitine CoA-transferase CaiB-like acyl-CoA transferase
MGALDGIRVLDAGLLVQGPQAAALMADMGAEVIKVELPGFGDQSRWIPVNESDRRAPYYVALNRGKRSVSVDLRKPDGREIFLRLVETADVVISNFKGGTLDAWGLSYEDVSARNPRIVYATGTVFGPIGPDAAREGADLAGQAAGGLISTTGVNGGEPTPVGVTIADFIASQSMANGILAALFARDRTGRGQRVDVSLVGSQIWAQASEYASFGMSGQQPGRSNYGHPLIHAAYFIVPTKDGWIALIGVPLPLRPAFYECIGRPDLAVDNRFTPGLYSPEVKAQLHAEFCTVFPQYTTAEWCERLRNAGQRYAPVRGYAEVMDDPQMWENGYLSVMEHPEWGNIRMPGVPIRMSDTPLKPGDTLAELGQDTEIVLMELGYAWEQIEAFRAASAI